VRKETQIQTEQKVELPIMQVKADALEREKKHGKKRKNKHPLEDKQNDEDKEECHIDIRI